MPVLLNRTRIRAGYDMLRAAEHRLPSQWRDPLLRVYARARTVHDQQEKRHQQRLKGWKFAFWLGSPLLFVFCGASLYFLAHDFEKGLLFGGLALCGIILLTLTSFFFRRTKKAPPLPHPLQEPLREELFPPLLPDWYRYLQPPAEKPTEADLLNDYGLEGEIRFVQMLEQMVGAEGLVFHRVQQIHGDDLDVILICPRGLWYFEVKYWSGEVKWQNGQWARRQDYYEAGGRLVTKRPAVTQPPNEQWSRMAQELKTTLEKRGIKLLRHCPPFEHIRGGLVFNYPTAQLQIAQSAPFRWGNEAQWRKILLSAPQHPDITSRNMLSLADVILERHQMLNPGLPLVSMENYAQNLLQTNEHSLEYWIKKHS
ncbi:MAG TPA: NERD domain-containing protein [Anaerolineales bacterium]|nr:NERD domain-containing protein [Anaerolineales bacterium]